MVVHTFAELAVTKDGFLMYRGAGESLGHYLFGESGRKRLVYDMSKLLLEREKLKLSHDQLMGRVK